MRSCDTNKKLLLDILAFIAFDMLDEKYNNNKLIITNRAKKYLDNNYGGRFDYIMNLKHEVIASTFMKEGVEGHIFAYSDKDEDIEDLFDYVVRDKLRAYIDNTKYNQDELTKEIEILAKEFHNGYMKNYSFLNQILLYVCGCYKIKPRLEKPIMIAL
ncbi:hypothetical protein QD96_22785 [Salmonella enterica subsp. enterica serovar Agona]|nr:hypothetical protein [Salmonella enterica subsp. enterica serovar Agona]ECM3716997.1 hypothetical protein [Salmonella enterica subsp. enterica serovar Agona]